MKFVLCGILIVLSIAAFIALPTISIDPNTVIASNVFQYLRAAMYFIPVDTAEKILGVALVLWVWRVIVSVIRTLWDMLPIA